MTDKRPLRADRSGADRRHRTGAPAHRLRLPTVWHGDVPTPAFVSAVYLRGRRTPVSWPRAASCGPGRSSALPPKAPPYLEAGVEEFEPYGVGYIELPGEVRVEARLTESDPERLRIGMAMELTLIPVPGASDRLTFAFRPGGGRRVSCGDDVAVVGARHPSSSVATTACPGSRWARSPPGVRSRTRGSRGRTWTSPPAGRMPPATPTRRSRCSG